MRAPLLRSVPFVGSELRVGSVPSLSVLVVWPLPFCWVTERAQPLICS